MKHKKEFILGTLGIFMIILGSFLSSSAIYLEKKAAKEETKEELKVKDEIIKLKLYRIDQTFFLQIPETFVKLDEETLKANYPNNNRPELIFQKEDNTTHVYITTSEIDMTDDNLESYLEQQKQQANIEIDQAKIYIKNDKTFAQFSRRDIGEDGYYYDTRYFTLENKLVIVEFNTTKSQEKDWTKVKNAILDSICFTEEQIKNSN